MSPRLLLSVSAIVSLLPARAAASDWVIPGGGFFAQLVDGAGSRSTITLINLDTVSAPYTLSFFDDNGNPLSLSTTAGSGTSLSGTLPLNGSVTIQTNGTSATNVQGYARLQTSNLIAGSLVFGLALTPFAEASCPLDTGSDDYFGIPFDHLTSTEGIAIANSRGTSSLTITVTFYDQTGTNFDTETIQLAPLAHTAFMLPVRFPKSAGKKGYVIFSASSYFNVLGLRATGSTFTSITPVIPQGF